MRAKNRGITFYGMNWREPCVWGFCISVCSENTYTLLCGNKRFFLITEIVKGDILWLLGRGSSKSMNVELNLEKNVVHIKVFDMKVKCI